MHTRKRRAATPKRQGVGLPHGFDETPARIQNPTRLRTIALDDCIVLDTSTLVSGDNMSLQVPPCSCISFADAWGPTGNTSPQSDATTRGTPIQ